MTIKIERTYWLLGAFVFALVLGTTIRWRTDVAVPPEVKQNTALVQDECTKALADGATLTLHDCYYELAIKQGEPAFCEKISKDNFEVGPLFYEQCYFDLAIKAHNVSLCGKIQGTLYNGGYTSCMAAVTGDQKTCESLSDKDEQSRCLTYAAIGRNDPSSCKTFFTDSDLSDYCIGFVALSMDDPTACDKISKAEERSQCHLKVQNSRRSTDWSAEIIK